MVVVVIIVEIVQIEVPDIDIPILFPNMFISIAMLFICFKLFLIFKSFKYMLFFFLSTPFLKDYSEYYSPILILRLSANDINLLFFAFPKIQFQRKAMPIGLHIVDLKRSFLNFMEKVHGKTCLMDGYYL